jgi:hypothetical protein
MVTDSYKSVVLIILQHFPQRMLQRLRTNIDKPDWFQFQRFSDKNYSGRAGGFECSGPASQQMDFSLFDLRVANTINVSAIG